ncbi:hypothetical protein C8R46DRAFT_1004988, partial [Mycena filopes]
MSFLDSLQVAHRVRWFSAHATNRLRSKTPLLSTLDPLLLQPSDYFDLSGCTSRCVRLAGVSQRGLNPPLIYRRPIGTPFPADSAGFLYFHRDSEAAPLEGGLRFRLCSNGLPSSFEAGQDLLLPTGLPWQLILPQLLNSGLRKLLEKLLSEKLVTATQISRCRELFGSRPHITPSSTLFRLGQEFPVDFEGHPTISIVTESLWRIRPTPFALRPGNNRSVWPFTGSGLARFEPSVVDGRRLVHMRITKITSPIVC